MWRSHCARLPHRCRTWGHGAITQVLGNHQADSHLATTVSSEEPAFQGTSGEKPPPPPLLSPHVQVGSTRRD